MSTSDNNFVQNLKKGRTGELFVCDYLDALITDSVSDVNDTAAEKITGKDCVATVVDQNGNKAFKNIEIKTVWSFLSRTNDEEDLDGTLCFELWSTNNKKQQGWLCKMLHPEKFAKAVCPDIFIFILVAYENAFASIAFENVPELIKRLRSAAKEDGFDLDHIPVGDAAQDWQPPKCTLIDNTWPVSFGLLKDIATVTIIGDKPRIRPDIISGVGGKRTCTAFTQSTRYDRLLAASDTRTPLVLDDKYRRAFTGDKADHLFAIIDYNLDVLANTDFKNKYSCLSKYNGRKGCVLDCLKWIMLNMLAHEHPSRELSGERFFPISYSWLSAFCRASGITRNQKTWLVNIKLAIAFELLDYYRPPKSSNNPIDIRVNQGNDKFASVGYYSAIKFTPDQLLQADYVAQNYIRDHVKTSQITKDVMLAAESNVFRPHEKNVVEQGYGFDHRKIAKAKDYVKELFAQTLTNMLYAQSFALPDNISKKVLSTMKKEKRLWTVEEHDPPTKEELREKARQEPYWREYTRLTDNMAELEDRSWNRYRKLTKEDQSWMDGSKKIKVGTKIFACNQIPNEDLPKLQEFRDKNRAKLNAKNRERYAKKKNTHK